MNEKQLTLFLAVAEHGSFSKAEEAEYISKQAMLRQINSLEQEVGVPLMVRSTSGISLTPAGDAFYQGAKELLALRKDVLARCRGTEPQPEVLRIGQVEHQTLLHRVTDAFMAKYPNDMKVYYESEDFICYVMPQNMYHQYNFAIDYGYNQVQAQEDKK